MQIQGSYREIWSISYPIILGSLAQSINQVIDTSFLGRVGIEDLAAATLSGMFYVLSIMVAMGFTRGSLVLIARRTGENNPSGVGAALDHLLLLCTLLMLVLGVWLYLIGPGVMPFMIDSPVLMEKAKIFIYYRSISIPVLIYAYGFNAFFAGIGKTKVITVATIAMALTNVFLDYGLIFGHFGMPKMGLAGAALASGIAEYVYFIVFVAAFFIRKNHVKYPFLKSRKIDWQLSATMMKIALPIAGQMLIGLGSWAVFFFFIEKMGEKALAISGIVKSLYIFIGIPGWGLGTATSSVISNILGQGRYEDVLPVIKRFVIISMVISFITIFLMALFPYGVMWFFTDDMLLVSETLPVLYTILIALLVFSLSVISFQAIVGIGATDITLKAEFVCVIMYLAYTWLAIFVFKTSLAVAWAGELLYWIVMLILCVLYLRSGKWKSLNKI